MASDISCGAFRDAHEPTAPQVNGDPEPPTVDPTGRIVQFGFRLQADAPLGSSLQFTLQGSALRLAKLSCRSLSLPAFESARPPLCDTSLFCREFNRP